MALPIVTTDYGGIALVIAAIGAFVVSMVGAGLQIAVFVRQGQQLKATVALHDSVNGQQKVLTELIGKEAFGAGILKQAGIEAERAPPSPT